MSTCVQCYKQLLAYQSKYCSNFCQQNYQYKAYILNWKSGVRSGERGISTKSFSKHVIRYLFEKYDSECFLCGWNQINVATGRSPLEIDHIDGNPDNNTEANLQLLCPNCHSLTSNYKNLNYGGGRAWRREKYVKIVKSPL